jgi:hypothetical protein
MPFIVFRRSSEAQLIALALSAKEQEAFSALPGLKVHNEQHTGLVTKSAQYLCPQPAAA